MKSPLPVFFFAALLWFGVALLLQSPVKNLGFELLERAGPVPALNSAELKLPKYYFETGRPDDAIVELNALLPSLSPMNAPAAQLDLGKLIALHENTLGQLGFMMLNAASFWPSKLFVAALLLGILFLVFLLNRI